MYRPAVSLGLMIFTTCEAKRSSSGGEKLLEGCSAHARLHPAYNSFTFNRDISESSETL